MGKLSDAVRRYFATTPKEVIKQHWAELSAYNSGGVDILDILPTKNTTDKMKKCRTYKCKAACCYNIALPVGLLEQFADKVVNKVIATSPMPVNPEFPPPVAVETSEKIAKNKCPFLRADYKCNIYEYRPLICRKFGDCSHPMLICSYMK